MSVIAKMRVSNVNDFGSGRLVEMSCICDNDLMTEYAGSEEDKLFTRYSPWGEIKLHQPSGWAMGDQNDLFYVMILSKDEAGEEPKFPGAYAFCQLRVASITDFGDGQAKRLEMCEGWQAKNCPSKGVANFNWKMAVDNPAVISQLSPGTENYFVAFYPAVHGRDGVIAKAHGYEA